MSICMVLLPSDPYISLNQYGSSSHYDLITVGAYLHAISSLYSCSRMYLFLNHINMYFCCENISMKTKSPLNNLGLKFHPSQSNTVGVLPASPPCYTLRWQIVGRESLRSKTRWCKQHKVQICSGHEYRNILCPIVWFVLPEGCVCFGGVPVEGQGYMKPQIDMSLGVLLEYY